MGTVSTRTQCLALWRKWRPGRNKAAQGSVPGPGDGPRALASRSHPAEPFHTGCHPLPAIGGFPEVSGAGLREVTSRRRQAAQADQDVYLQPQAQTSARARSAAVQEPARAAGS